MVAMVVISLLFSLVGLVISIIALVLSVRKYNLSRQRLALDMRDRQLSADSLIEQMGSKIGPLVRDIENLRDFQKKMAEKLTFEDNMELGRILLQIKAEMDRVKSDLKLDLAKLGYSLDEITKKIIEKYDLQDDTEAGIQNTENGIEMFLHGTYGQRLVRLEREVLSRCTKAEARKLGFILNKDGSITEVAPDSP